MKVIYFISVLLSTIGCSVLNKDEKTYLSIKRIPFTGNELKLNGYYFQIWDDNNQKRFSNVTFLYENGILLDIGGGGLLSEIDTFVTENVTKNFSNYKGFWGVFWIQKNSIKWEKYYVGQTGEKVFRYEGEVLADTIFTMKKYSQIDRGIKREERVVENIYYFKAFAPKPSSENNFIK